jgi:PEP-CTERM motif
MNSLIRLAVGIACASSAAAFSAPVIWVDWTSGTAGTSGSATGTIDLGALGPDSADLSVSYTGEIQFIQTSGGINYWDVGPNGTYQSAAVNNRPATPDIIALSRATSKTLSFSSAVDNLFFAVVSLNGNGYEFNENFTIESFGQGYWGNGTLTKQDMGNGKFRLIGSGEPHGTIRFDRAVSSITWTSLTNENWNGFTVGTYGLAPPPVPEPSTWALFALGLAGLAVASRRRHGRG